MASPLYVQFYALRIFEDRWEFNLFWSK